MERLKSVSNSEGIRQQCELVLHLLRDYPHQQNQATRFAIRTLLREAVNKSKTDYRGNVNQRNAKYISLEAKAQQKVDPKAKLVADHIVPISLLVKKVHSSAQNKQFSVDDLMQLARDFTELVLITTEEDRKLVELGLSKKMPIDWDEQDPHARYKQANIKFVERE